MSHYDDYYDRDYETEKAKKLETHVKALQALQQLRVSSYKDGWTFSDVDCDTLFVRMIEKIKARIYDLS